MEWNPTVEQKKSIEINKFDFFEKKRVKRFPEIVEKLRQKTVDH